MRRFTTISETLTPESLCDLMNDYFTPMTEIILKSQGVLDKYIGDAIMAFGCANRNVQSRRSCFESSNKYGFCFG